MKKREYSVMSGTDRATNKQLHGAQLVEATALNLLITAALTRSSLQELSELLRTGGRQFSLAIPVMEGLMQSALLETGLSHILSSYDLAKTLDFTFQGSLKISSDEYGIAVQMDGVTLSVDAHATMIDLSNFQGDTDD